MRAVPSGDFVTPSRLGPPLPSPDRPRLNSYWGLPLRTEPAAEDEDEPSRGDE
jgi:hypothetical protein